MTKLHELPREELERIFNTAPFISSLGIKLVAVRSGYCETSLAITPNHLQQDGFVHAGVQATLADHSAGGAAATLVGPDQFVLTVEFKINLLKTANGHTLRCKAAVLKPGARLTVVESEVFCESGAAPTLVSKATATIAVVTRSRHP